MPKREAIGVKKLLEVVRLETVHIRCTDYNSLIGLTIILVKEF